jgi:hypothetical protein
VICEAAGRIRAGTSDQETGNEGQIAQISSPLRDLDLDLDRPCRQFISSFSRMVGLVPKIGKAQVPASLRVIHRDTRLNDAIDGRPAS